MRRKLLILLGISVLSSVVFVLAIFFTLPSDKFRHFAEKTIENQLKQKQTVEIDDISVSPLLNITAKGFKMTPRVSSPPQPALETEDKVINDYFCASSVEEIPFIIDKITVDPAVFETIKKKPSGSFKLNLKGGTIQGDVKTRDKLLEIVASGKQISLNDFALLSNFTKMQIYGDLQFDMRAVIAGSKLVELSGTALSADTVMCPKRLKLNIGGIPYIDLPFTTFGNIDADIEIKNNRLVINKLTSDGPDIKLEVTGDVSLKSPAEPNPRLNIKAVITPDAKWVTDNDMKVLYQLCEKHDDGSIHLSLKGTTKRIKHDCGTPIPEPVEAVAAPEPDKAAEKPAEAKPPKTAEKAAEKPDPDSSANVAAPEKKEKKRLDEGNTVYRPQIDRRSRDSESGGMRDEGFPRTRGNNSMARPPRPKLGDPAREAQLDREIERIEAEREDALRRSGRSRERMPRLGQGNPDATN